MNGDGQRDEWIMDDDCNSSLVTDCELKVMLEENEGLTHESQFAGCGEQGKATTLAGGTKACKLFRLVPDAFD